MGMQLQWSWVGTLVFRRWDYRGLSSVGLRRLSGRSLLTHQVSVEGSLRPQATGGEFLWVNIKENQGDTSWVLHFSICDQRGLRAGYKYQVGPSQESIRAYVTLYERTPSGESQRWMISGETQGRLDH